MPRAWLGCRDLPRNGRQPPAVRPLSDDGRLAEQGDDRADLPLFRGSTRPSSIAIRRRATSPARSRTAGKAGNRFGEGPIAARIFSTPRPTIEPGFYQTFFSIPGHGDEILCSITAIRAEEDRTTFRRLTGLSETRGTTWSYFRGDHEGVVMERLNWFYFLGLNRRGPMEPTFCPCSGVRSRRNRCCAATP